MALINGRPVSYVKSCHRPEKVDLHKVVREYIDSAGREATSRPQRAADTLHFVSYLLARYRSTERMVEIERLYEQYTRLHPDRVIEPT